MKKFLITILWFMLTSHLYGQKVLAKENVKNADVNKQIESGKVVMPKDYKEAPQQSQNLQKYALDESGAKATNFSTAPMNDNMIFYTLRSDRTEYRFNEEKTLLWDVESWIGGDYNKLYIESEGTYSLDSKQLGTTNLDLLYSRNISTFWDLQLGFSRDFNPGEDRNFFQIGFQGLAPYFFEVDSALKVSSNGDISLEAEIEYDLLITQRLILQPRTEISMAVQEVTKYGVGNGLNSFELGSRLRYEFSRKFAPYVGLSWEQKTFEAYDYAKANGESTSEFNFLAGVKFWL